MIKTIIADDHAIVRRGLIEILESDDSFSLVSEASNGIELLEKLKKEEYHVVILDLNMPERNGLSLIKDIKSISPKTSILILSVNTEMQIVTLSLKLGANGYISKESIPQELIKAIKKVFYGERYISASIAEKLVFEFSEERDQLPHEKLSLREYQTFCLLGAGKSIKAIADEMGLSIKTISTFRTRIMEKMNLKDNLEIIHYYIKHNIVDNK